MTPSRGPGSAEEAALPVSLLTAIVRKEALLPEHTAAFAAAQLLPVIQTGVARHLAARPGQFPPELCAELLVSSPVIAV